MIFVCANLENDSIEMWPTLKSFENFYQNIEAAFRNKFGKSCDIVQNDYGNCQVTVREAFKKEIRWKLGHCPNSSGSLPSLPRLGRI